jgi:4,5-dihydroxyphthalate decarboxylase
MERLTLSLACGNYDINRALIDGSVAPIGVRLIVHVLPSPERHWRMARFQEFDICEFSLASYVAAAGRDALPVLAVPAFPHRRFRHGYVLCRSGSGIHDPKDLEGRRVGLRSWQTTAGLWVRGILHDDYGVDLSSITWLTQDEEDIPIDPPRRHRVERVPAGRSVLDLLAEGVLDALVYPELPDPASVTRLGLYRLFQEPKRAEADYYRRTGFFPIMHVVVIRRSLLEAHPWLARSVLEAFRASKNLAFAAMRDPRHVSLAWFAEALAEQESILGPDPWAYAFEPNERLLATVIRWSVEQELLPAWIVPTDLFHPAVLDDPPGYI